MENERDDRFVEQFTACQSRLYRFIATLVFNRADAEELFQEASLAAWRSRDKFDGAGEFFPWLCGIARNHVRNYYRSRKAAPLVLALEVVDQLIELQIEEEPLLERRQEALTLCLQKLTPRQRQVLRQFNEKSQTVASFSHEQGATVGALYKMLQRIRAALLDCIERTLQEAR